MSAVFARRKPEVENRYDWFLHFVDGPQWSTGNADGSFGRGYISQAEAEHDARAHGMVVVPDGLNGTTTERR